MKPVARGHCRYHQLMDGTYTIDHLADFHEMMDEQDEYERRYQAAAEAARERK